MNRRNDDGDDHNHQDPSSLLSNNNNNNNHNDQTLKNFFSPYTPNYHYAPVLHKSYCNSTSDTVAHHYDFPMKLEPDDVSSSDDRRPSAFSCAIKLSTPSIPAATTTATTSASSTAGNNRGIVDLSTAALEKSAAAKHFSDAAAVAASTASTNYAAAGHAVAAMEQSTMAMANQFLVGSGIKAGMVNGFDVRASFPLSPSMPQP
uniref:Uncharacterized protein n=1 Tax=Romanomermis culicivorax TaxID=13658 RepID=A0A915HRR6_ROMCU